MVLSALNAASTGTHALENAANTVSGIIGDLDTTIMFATAGTLNAEDGDDAFAGRFHVEAVSFPSGIHNWSLQITARTY